MAYVKKYTYEFKALIDYTSEEFILNIYEDGFFGASTAITGIEADSIVMSREGDLLENVQGTKLTFTIINTSEGEFKEFRDADWGQYKVELIQDPSGTPQTKFIGYNQSEIYTESYNLEGHTKTEWTCGLNHLKHVRWDASGTLHTGQKTIIEVLRLALNLLPEPVDVREFINIYEDSINATTTDSMFNQIYVDSTVYKENEQEGGVTVESAFFAHRVIEEILKPFNAHIYHWNGIWYIINPQEYTSATLYYRQFIPRVGSESTVTVDSTGNFASNTRSVTGVETPRTANELILPMDAELSIEPALNRVSVEYDLDNLDLADNDLIKNGCWDVLDIPDPNNQNEAQPEYWTFTGSDYTTYQAMFGIAGEMWYQFSPTPQSTASSFNSGVHGEYSKNGITTDTNDSLQFSFRGRFEGRYVKLPAGALSNSPQNFVKNDLEFTWEVEIQLGTYYLDGNPDDGFTWTTTASRAVFKKKGFEANGGYLANIRESFEIIQTLPTCPQSAVVNFRFRVYRAYHNWSTYAATNVDFTMTFEHLFQRCFSLVYLPSQVPPIQELVIYSKIIEDENLEEITVMHGDGPNSITLNSFRLSTGVITNEWTRRGKADAADILVILLRQLRDLRGEFIQNVSGRLVGEINPYNSIEYTTDVSTDYWIKTYEWNIVQGEWNVNLQELITSVVSLATSTSIKTRPTQTDISPIDTDTPETPAESSRIITNNPPISGNQTNLANF